VHQVHGQQNVKKKEKEKEKEKKKSKRVHVLFNHKKSKICASGNVTP
jgi:hypothetical protein